MTWQVIAVPSGFMDSIQAIVNGFIWTITAWFPQVLLIAVFVSVTLGAIGWVYSKVKKSSHGR